MRVSRQIPKDVAKKALTVLIMRERPSRIDIKPAFLQCMLQMLRGVYPNITHSKHDGSDWTFMLRSGEMFVEVILDNDRVKALRRWEITNVDDIDQYKDLNKPLPADVSELLFRNGAKLEINPTNERRAETMNFLVAVENAMIKCASTTRFSTDELMNAVRTREIDTVLKSRLPPDAIGRIKEMAAGRRKTHKLRKSRRKTRKTRRH